MIPKLARKLGQAGIGLKNRNFRSLPASNPSAQQWIEFLAREPLEGGLRAEEVVTPVTCNPMQEQLDAIFQPMQPIDPIEAYTPEAALGKRDARLIIRQLERTAHRKNAPPWCLPPEIWLILLKPSITTQPDKLCPVLDPDAPEIGRYKDGRRAHETFPQLRNRKMIRDELEQLLTHCRMAEGVPEQAYLSRASLPVKKTARTPARGVGSSTQRRDCGKNGLNPYPLDQKDRRT